MKWKFSVRNTNESLGSVVKLNFSLNGLTDIILKTDINPIKIESRMINREPIVCIFGCGSPDMTMLRYWIEPNKWGYIAFVGYNGFVPTESQVTIILTLNYGRTPTTIPEAVERPEGYSNKPPISYQGTTTVYDYVLKRYWYNVPYWKYRVYPGRDVFAAVSNPYGQIWHWTCSQMRVIYL